MTEDLDSLLLPDGRLKPMNEAKRSSTSRKRKQRTSSCNPPLQQEVKECQRTTLDQNPSLTRPARSVKHRFTMLNNFCDVTLRDLSTNEIAVWLSLFRDTRDGIACSSQMELARRCGVCKNNLQNNQKA